MPITFKIAYRNIFKHKTKSIVIGIILFIGAFIMTLGNGIITGMNKGFSKNIVDNFIGHSVIVSKNQKNDAVVFNFMAESIEVFNNYFDIKSFLKKQDYIDKFMPAAFGAPLALCEEGGEPDFNFVLGVDFKEYKKMFPDNLNVIEGRYPKENEKAFLLTDSNRDLNFQYLLGYWIKPKGEKLNTDNLTKEAKELGDKLKVKDRMIFMGFSDKNTSLDISAPVKGIIKYKALNKFLGFFNLIDIESFRNCFGYFSAYDNSTSLSKEETMLLDSKNEDLENLFKSDSIVTDTIIHENYFDKNTLKTNTKKTQIINTEKGAYNQIYIKFKNSKNLNKIIKTLNKKLDNTSLNVRAISWKKAMGEMADIAMLMKGALFIFVMFIFFVAIIIIMNTLSMTALERISEIGMMRAVGAKKSFIIKMFFFESAFLSLIFGGLGIITGLIIVKVLYLMNITTDGEMMQLFFGGDRFIPYLSITDIFLSIFQLFIVTVLATIYPVFVAKKITPLDAIARD